MTIGEALDQAVNNPEISLYEIASKLGLDQSQLILETRKRAPDSFMSQADMGVAFIAGALWMKENAKTS